VRKIAIIGGGSWGTALSLVLARGRQTHRISLWAHSADVVEVLRARRVNEIYLPEFKLPPEVEVTGNLGQTLAGAEIVLGVMPSAHAREVYRAMRPHVEPHAVFVSATKGLEHSTHARMSEVISAELGTERRTRIAVLSGPSFALEVARGDPTAVVIAAEDPGLAADIQAEFSGPTFRLYTNDDVVGTEIAGSVKNVIAIASGVCAGIGFGSNTAAALVTRGLAEMTRLAVALGGRRDTLAGLAGVGDLILTCTGALSRNRAVGIELGKGTAAATLELAGRAGVEMPITEQVHALLTAGRAPRDAIRELMERRLKQE
jgi:glycerol-3-phosphate dehydrogenase (NAD(P)+)